jgi:hypothetical protein
MQVLNNVSRYLLQENRPLNDTLGNQKEDHIDMIVLGTSAQAYGYLFPAINTDTSTRMIKMIRLIGLGPFTAGGV